MTTNQQAMTPLATPPWYAYAQTKLGLREIAGSRNNPYIIDCFKLAGLPESMWDDSKTAWCGCFVNRCLHETGFRGVRGPAGARNWAKPSPHLVELDKPVHGCILVFSRPPNPAHGHVGFYDYSPDDEDEDDWYYNVLGGNQNNSVKIKPYPKSRYIGAYWPAAYPLPEGAHLLDNS